MSLIQIKQLGEKCATAGLHMGGDDTRRKLEPGEIVDIPDDELMLDGDNLMEGLWETGKIDLVPPTEAPTRPLDYASRREAQLCSPTFRPRDPRDELDMKKARAKVAARLLEQFESLPKKKKADSPEDDTPKTAPPKSRRAARRTKAEVAEYGEANPT